MKLNFTVLGLLAILVAMVARQQSDVVRHSGPWTRASGFAAPVELPAKLSPVSVSDGPLLFGYSKYQDGYRCSVLDPGLFREPKTIIESESPITVEHRVGADVLLVFTEGERFLLCLGDATVRRTSHGHWFFHSQMDDKLIVKHFPEWDNSTPGKSHRGPMKLAALTPLHSEPSGLTNLEIRSILTEGERYWLVKVDDGSCWLIDKGSALPDRQILDAERAKHIVEAAFSPTGRLVAFDVRTNGPSLTDLVIVSVTDGRELTRVADIPAALGFQDYLFSFAWEDQSKIRFSKAEFSEKSGDAEGACQPLSTGYEIDGSCDTKGFYRLMELDLSKNVVLELRRYRCLAWWHGGSAFEEPPEPAWDTSSDQHWRVDQDEASKQTRVVNAKSGVSWTYRSRYPSNLVWDHLERWECAAEHVVDEP